VKRGRDKEPRIHDAATHPRRYVSLIVAAEYLAVDRKTISGWLDEGRLPFYEFGKRRRILLADLIAYESSSHRQAS